MNHSFWCLICGKISKTSPGLIVVQIKHPFWWDMYFFWGGHIFWGGVGGFSIWFDGIYCPKMRDFASENAAPEGLWV